MPLRSHRRYTSTRWYWFVRCLDLFSPFVPNTTHKNKIVDFTDRLPKYPMKRWECSVESRTLMMSNEAFIKFLEVLVTCSCRWSLKLGARVRQKWSHGLEIIRPRYSEPSPSPLKIDSTNRATGIVLRCRCLHRTRVENASLLQLIGGIIHRVFEIDFFWKFHACYLFYVPQGLLIRVFRKLRILDYSATRTE